MKQFIQQHCKWIAINGIIWCLSKQLFLAIKVWGIENTSFESIHVPVLPMFMVVALTGIIDGIAFGLIDVVIDTRFKSLRFSWRVMSKTVLNMLVGLTLTMLLAPVFLQSISGHVVDPLARQISSAQIIVLGIYFLLLTIIVQFLKLTLAWMKTQDIFEVIANPYGVQEERIFLFLDMKSSTTLAERLEASTYSRLLQECFHDLSGAANDTGAEIYQYVGDEAVLTWKESEENFVSAVRFFFGFQQRLSDRAGEYQALFDAVPEFKAGIHHGKVIKAQVGMMRKEIAFHGDAINTASRIQGKCNELHRHLLVSEAFKDHLEGKFECDLEGKFTIRGKSLEMNLYSIREPAINPAERNQKTTQALNGILALGLGAVSTYVRIVASLFQN